MDSVAFHHPHQHVQKDLSFVSPQRSQNSIVGLANLGMAATPQLPALGRYCEFAGPAIGAIHSPLQKAARFELVRRGDAGGARRGADRRFALDLPQLDAFFAFDLHAYDAGRRRSFDRFGRDDRAAAGDADPEGDGGGSQKHSLVATTTS